MPNLTTSLNLEELTIQTFSSDSSGDSGGLRQLPVDFCHTKFRLKKLDLSMNRLESLAFIFDECQALNLLDLSYNSIGSLERMFNQMSSSLLYFILDHNEIR